MIHSLKLLITQRFCYFFKENHSITGMIVYKAPEYYSHR